jgi:uncharacterized protein (TIGR03435 family)
MRAVVLVLRCCSQSLSLAQSTSASQLEVASVRQMAASDSRAGARADGSRRTRAGSMSEPAGRISYQEVTLKALLAKAYGLRPDQIGGPAWIDSDLFSVNAIVPEAAPTDEVPAILQNLLVERFQMTTHSEMKEEPVYVLSAGTGASS